MLWLSAVLVLAASGPRSGSDEGMPKNWASRVQTEHIICEPETLPSGGTILLVIGGRRVVIPQKDLKDDQSWLNGLSERDHAVAFDRSPRPLTVEKREPTGRPRAPSRRQSELQKRATRNMEASRRQFERQRERLRKANPKLEKYFPVREKEEADIADKDVAMRVGGYIGFRGINAVPHVVLESETWIGSELTFFKNGNLAGQRVEIGNRENLRAGPDDYSIVYLTPIEIDRNLFVSAVAYDSEKGKFLRYELMQKKRIPKRSSFAHLSADRIVFLNDRYWKPVEHHRQVMVEQEVRPGVYRETRQTVTETVRPTIEDISPTGSIQIRYVDIEPEYPSHRGKEPPADDFVYTFAPGVVTQIELADGTYVFDRESRVYRNNGESPTPVTDTYLYGLDGNAKERLFKTPQRSRRIVISAADEQEDARSSSWEDLTVDEQVRVVVEARRRNPAIGTEAERRARLLDWLASQKPPIGKLTVRNATSNSVEFQLNGFRDHKGTRFQFYQFRGHPLLLQALVAMADAWEFIGIQPVWYPVAPGTNRWKIAPGETLTPTFRGGEIACSWARYALSEGAEARSYFTYHRENGSEICLLIHKSE